MKLIRSTFFLFLCISAVFISSAGDKRSGWHSPSIDFYMNYPNKLQLGTGLVGLGTYGLWVRTHLTNAATLLNAHSYLRRSLSLSRLQPAAKATTGLALWLSHYYTSNKR